MPKREAIRKMMPCEVCAAEVSMGGEALIEASEGKRTVLCGRCRRYVSSSRCRVSQLPSEASAPAVGLARKSGKSAKHKRGLASCPLRRML